MHDYSLKRISFHNRALLPILTVSKNRLRKSHFTRKMALVLFLAFTLFENDSKCLIQVFEFSHFSPILVLLKLTGLVTLFDSRLQVFKNSPNWIIFGIFNEVLSTLNVNVARFARNVK